MFLCYKWESRGLFREKWYFTNGKAKHDGANGTLLKMGKPRSVQNGKAEDIR